MHNYANEVINYANLLAKTVLKAWNRVFYATFQGENHATYHDEISQNYSMIRSMIHRDNGKMVQYWKSLISYVVTMTSSLHK